VIGVYINPRDFDKPNHRTRAKRSGFFIDFFMCVFYFSLSIMSLQASIRNLNNNLISLFSIVDGWCDRGGEFLNGYDKFSASPRDTMVKFINLNTHVLQHLEDISKYEQLMVELKPKSLLALVSESTGNFSKLQEENPEALRELMREQLFRYLCLIDNFHSRRLDVSFSLVSPEFGKGLELIQSLTKHATDMVMQHEAQYVMS
jgi:hypothetical protein